MTWEQANVLCRAFLIGWEPLMRGEILKGGAPVFVNAYPYWSEEIQDADYEPVCAIGWKVGSGAKQYGNYICVSCDTPPEAGFKMHLMRMLQDSFDEVRAKL